MEQSPLNDGNSAFAPYILSAVSKLRLAQCLYVRCRLDNCVWTDKISAEWNIETYDGKSHWLQNQWLSISYDCAHVTVSKTTISFHVFLKTLAQIQNYLASTNLNNQQRQTGQIIIPSALTSPHQWPGPGHSQSCLQAIPKKVRRGRYPLVVPTGQ